ncbi:hypothetical protein [Chitinophaga filiformis]|uniref:Uncharacterized protein n=1 Tax=Chitinophaga filiformis TaxID=104663 RepID=A0A1G7S3Q8_CHIFI|nr:hypothetical protein [Chitinophaga filiformis]SDG17623.1 hypothetical protein SAMN04488121_103723 [Chitinophaga filiformis]
MKEMDDKKLQELLEKGLAGQKAGLSPEEAEELEVYSMLFEALGNEAAPDLPRDFAVKVTAKLERRKQRMAEARFYLIVVFCCLFLGGSSFAALMHFGGGAVISNFISRYGTIFILGIILLLLIQYLDQKLVKQTFLKER